MGYLGTCGHANSPRHAATILKQAKKSILSDDYLFISDRMFPQALLFKKKSFWHGLSLNVIVEIDLYSMKCIQMNRKFAAKNSEIRG